MTKHIAYNTALSIAIGCGIYIAILVALFGVNIPYWDEWSLSDVLVLYRDDRLTLGHLLSQHNESRKLFPRLIMLLCGRWFDWNVRLEMALSVAIAATTFFGLTLLAKRAGWSLHQRAAFVLLAGLLVFSPVQGHNYLMGIQFISFTVAFALVCNLLIATHSSCALARYGTTAALAFVATYSFANGMIVWFLTFPVLVTAGGRRRLSIRDLLWLLAAASSLLLYFWDYERPGHHPLLSDSLVHPTMVLPFYAVFLGSALGRGLPIPSEIACGFIGTLLIAAALICLVETWHLARRCGLNALEPLLPWGAIALYGYGSGLVTALGRAPFGVSEALHGRFVTVSIYATIGVAALGMQLYTERKRMPDAAEHRFAAAGSGLLAVLATAAALSVYPGSVHMRDLYYQRRQAYEAFAQRRVTSEIAATLYPLEAHDFLLARFVQLSHLGYLDEPLRTLEPIRFVDDEGCDDEPGTAATTGEP